MGKTFKGPTENERGGNGGISRKASLLVAVLVSILFVLSPAANALRAESEWNRGFAANATSVRFGTVEKYEIAGMSGFDRDNRGATTEIDCRHTGNFVLGSLPRHGYKDTDPYAFPGEIGIGGYGASLYGTYYFDNFYVDAVGSYGSKDHEQALDINRSAWSAFYDMPTTGTLKLETEPDGEEYAFSVGTGYVFNRESFSFGPYLRANYLKSEIVDYAGKLRISDADPSQGLAVRLDDRGIESLTTSLGGWATYVFSTNLGVLTPYMRLEWEHEYENDSGALKGRFLNSLSGVTDEDNVLLVTTDDPDRDYFNFGLGLTMVFPNGFMAFMDYETILGLEDIDSHQFAAGLRFEY